MPKKMLYAVIFVLVAMLTIQTAIAQFIQYPQTEKRLWLIQGNTLEVFYTTEDNVQLPRPPGVIAGIIAPEPVTGEQVVAAWSYAFRYSADGLDLPNYEAARELLLERHPTWDLIWTSERVVSYDADLADMDTPTAPQVTVTP
jgi:hypothetical protein